VSDADWKDWRATVKARVRLPDVIGKKLKIRGDGKALCPFHTETTPSFTVYADHYHCFGCGQRGDVFDWLESEPGGSFPKAEAIKEVGRLAGVDPPKIGGAAMPIIRSSIRAAVASGPTPSDSAAGDVDPEGEAEASVPAWIEDLVAQAHTALMARQSPAAIAAWAYLERRGLVTVAESLRFGVFDGSVRVSLPGRRQGPFRGRLILPTLEDGRAVWFKARYVGPLSDEELKAQGDPKYDGPSGTIPAPFNPRGLERAKDMGFLVPVEGEIDAASLLVAYGAEYPVIGLPGGKLPEGWAEKIAAARVPVYLLMDPDAAGDKHAETARAALEALEAQRLPVLTVKLQGHPDLNAALQALDPAGLADVIDAATAAADATRTEGLADLAYIRSGFLAEADARANRPHRAYSTGLPGLDRLLEGGYGEGFHIVGGITGGGKTSLALSIALHNALEGRPVVYATYEQSRYELWARIAARLTGVPQGAIKRGVYTNQGQPEPVSSHLKVAQGWADLEKAASGLKIVEGGDALSRAAGTWTVETLARTASELADAYGAPPLVIVDYLQRMPAPAELKVRDVRERVSYIAGALQVRLARGVGCPVLALSSLSRAAYRLADADVEGKLAAFKEAGEVEYTAYSALLLYGVPAEHHAVLKANKRLMDPNPPLPVALDLVKNREGERGRVVAHWRPRGDTWKDAGTWPEDGPPTLHEATK